VAQAATAEQSARCVAECAGLELEAARATRRERTAMRARWPAAQRVVVASDWDLPLCGVCSYHAN
jgi:microcystin degradation protein MlrC